MAPATKNFSVLVGGGGGRGIHVAILLTDSIKLSSFHFSQSLIISYTCDSVLSKTQYCYIDRVAVASCFHISQTHVLTSAVDNYQRNIGINYSRASDGDFFIQKGTIWMNEIDGRPPHCVCVKRVSVRTSVACHIGSVLEWLGRMINSVITELWNYVDDPFHT